MRASFLVLLLFVAGCKGKVGDVCEVDSDCAGDGAICEVAFESLTKQCGVDCDGSCEEGVCVAFLCKAPCEADADCPSGTVCAIDVDTKVCQPACSIDDECSGSSVCSGGVCVVP